MTGDLAQMLYKTGYLFNSLPNDYNSLMNKSNEAVLNLGIMMCVSQSKTMCAKSCMEVLVPGEGTIFSTCTLCEGNPPRTQSILGANGVIVRQQWVMSNKAWRLQTSSPSTIRSLLFLAYSHGAEAQSSIRGETALLPAPPNTWSSKPGFFSTCPRLNCALSSPVHSDKQNLDRVPLYNKRVRGKHLHLKQYENCARFLLFFALWAGHVQARNAQRVIFH